MKSVSEAVWVMVGLILAVLVLTLITVFLLKGKGSLDVTTAETDLRNCCFNFCAAGANNYNVMCRTSDGGTKSLLELCEIARGSNQPGIICSPCDC